MNNNIRKAGLEICLIFITLTLILGVVTIFVDVSLYIMLAGIASIIGLVTFAIGEAKAWRTK
jgi:hypothetical protein